MLPEPHFLFKIRAVMFTLRNISKIYKKGELTKAALSDVNLVLPDAGMVFIVGKSGSGKSTLINIASGLDSPTSGSISYNGHEYSSLEGRDFDSLHNHEFCSVFQDYCLIEGLSVEENIALGSLQKARKRKKPIQELLKRVGLEGYSKKKVKELSGGEKQRVAIARALLKTPKVLFCDEPTGNLDPSSTLNVLGLLKASSKKALVLIVTHDINIAYEFGDRVVTLENGKIVDDRSYSKSLQDSSLRPVSPRVYTNEKEIETINVLLKEKKIKGLTSRFNLFSESKPEEKEEREVPLSNGSKVACRTTIFRMFNKKPAKMVLLSLLTSVVTSLLALCYSIQEFSKDNYIKKNESLFENGIVVRKVDYFAENLDEGFASSLYKVEDEELQKAKSLAPAPFDQLYRTVFSHKLETTNPMFKSTGPSFRSFYLVHSTDLLFTTRDSFQKAMGLSKTECLASVDDPKEYGVYMTDYFADSYFQTKQISKPDYSSLLGWNYGSGYCDGYYVNGILKTNYKNRLSSLYDKTVVKKKTLSPDDKTEHLKDFDFITEHLATLYNFDMDGEAFFSEANETNAPSTLKVTLSVRGERYASEAIDVGFSDTLADDEVAVGQGYTHLFLSGSYSSASQADAALGSLPGASIGIETYQQGSDPYRLKANRLVCKQAHAELGNRRGAVLVSPKVFRELKKRYFYPLMFYFQPGTDYRTLNDFIRNTPFDYSGSSFAYIQIISDSLGSFSDVFKILTVAALAAMIALASFYALDLVKGEKYDVGVLKSLGLRNRTLDGQIVLAVLLFALIHALFFAPGYWALSKLAVKILSRSFSGTSISYGPFLASAVCFEPLNYLIVNLIELLVAAGLSLLLMIYLARFKPIAIIKNKE